MSTPQPVNGNGQFTRLWANSAQENHINIGKADIFNVQKLSYSQMDQFLGNFSEVEVLGYTPLGMTTAQAYPVNIAPNLPIATLSTDPNLMKLPIGAIVTGVTVAPLETFVSSGTPTFSVGAAAFDTADTRFIDSGTLAGLNASALRATATLATALDEDGVLVGGKTILVDANFVSFTVETDPITAGNAVIRIRYIPPNTLAYA